MTTLVAAVDAEVQRTDGDFAGVVLLRLPRFVGDSSSYSSFFVPGARTWGDNDDAPLFFFGLFATWGEAIFISPFTIVSVTSMIFSRATALLMLRGGGRRRETEMTREPLPSLDT